MFHKPSDLDQANISCDGAVIGESSAHQTSPAIRVSELTTEEVSVVKKILDLAFDPYATSQIVTQEICSRYGHTEHAGLAAKLTQRIQEVGVVQTYRELGADSEEMIQDARKAHYKRVGQVTEALATAANLLGKSRNEAAPRRADLLTALKVQIERVGPYLALDEIDIKIRPPLSTGSFERVAGAYIASMFCANPIDALEFMLDEPNSKVVNYIDVEYLQERFARNGGKFISDGDMRELARKVV